MRPEPVEAEPAGARVAPAERPRVYLDSAASTPIDPAVASRVAELAGLAANPASVHSAGVRATREIERARARIAACLGAEPEEITFTSGATEANNFALKGAILGRGGLPRVLVSAVEHPSVSEPLAWLAAVGLARVETLPVGRDGRVAPATLDAALGPDTVLVSVQQANNETGVLQDLAALGARCRAAGVLFHVDASQGFRKAPLDVAALGIDLLTASAHKLHGPKGVGLLYVRAGVELVPLLHGGGQERGLRGGTLNTPGIAGFGDAVSRYTAPELARVAALRDHFEAAVRARFPQARFHGAEAPRVPTISNLAFPGHTGKSLLIELDRRGICVSTSSACHATRLTPSPVLKAMGLEDADADEALRVSFGRTTRVEEVDLLLDQLTELLARRTACP